MLYGKYCNRWRSRITSFPFAYVIIKCNCLSALSSPPALPSPSWLWCLGFSCQLASLATPSRFSIVLSSAWDQLAPAHCLRPSLDQPLSYPRIPPCRIPVCRALQHCWWKPPWLCSQNFHSQYFIHAFDCHFWDGSVAKEKGPLPCSNATPCGDISYQVLLFNFLWLEDKGANPL